MEDDKGTTGSSTYNIIKLNETNYLSWAQQVEWILDERELWGIVSGEEKKPVEEEGVTIPNLEEKVLAYGKNAKKARSIIGTSVSAGVMTYIRGMSDPAKMWKTLADKYDPKTRSTLLQAVKQLSAIKLDEGGNMEEHLQRLEGLKRRIEERDEKISKTIYNGILLGSVSSEYDTIVSILESQSDLEPDAIIDRFLEEYRKRKGNGLGKESKTAMLTKQTAKGKNPQGRAKKCFSCGKEGHIEANCWIKHPELKPKKGKNGSRNNEKEEAKFSLQATVSEDIESEVNEVSSAYWFLDSGASEHFSPHKGLFISLDGFENPCRIETAKGTIYGVAKGDIPLTVIADNIRYPARIMDTFTPPSTSYERPPKQVLKRYACQLLFLID